MTKVWAGCAGIIARVLATHAEISKRISTQKIGVVTWCNGEETRLVILRSRVQPLTKTVFFMLFFRQFRYDANFLCAMLFYTLPTILGLGRGSGLGI